MGWAINGKDSEVKAVIHKLEYNGKWMQESYLTATIESPVPLDFQFGDWIEYRGERFEINYDPGKIKSAPRYTKGDAFKYENVKFNSLADELTRCDFLDVVPDDNSMHFTGLPKFSFYGSVWNLAERIQANLDRAYGKNMWSVEVSSEYKDTNELNVNIDTKNCQDALEICVSGFNAYYTIKGRHITIGAAGVPAAHLFKYGKGNGLYEIEQNAEADQKIVTRLRAYGSTRNIPHRYYNSLTGADGVKLIPDNMAVRHLMLPEFPYSTYDPFIDSKNITILGIREGTIFFDGSQEGLDEIYPSIEGMTAEDLKKAGVPCNSTGELDVIVSAEQIADDGVGVIDGSEVKPADDKSTFKITLKDLGFNPWEHLSGETPAIAFNTGKLGDRKFEIVDCKAIAGGGYELELNRIYDSDIQRWFPYNDYNANAGDKLVLLYIGMPEVYIKAAAQRLKTATEAWLEKNDYSRSVYAPKIDEIFMARQHDLAMASGGKIVSLHDTLKEGMQLLFEDDDLQIDAAIFIEQLTIKEGDDQIPTYEVVLKEEKTVGTLQKIQNQIDSLVSGKGQGSGGYTAAQIRNFISTYGRNLFLSKIYDDRTPYDLAVGGLLRGEGGVQFGPAFASGMTGFGGMIDGKGVAELHSLALRAFLEAPELRFNRTKIILGNSWSAPGAGIVQWAVPDTDASGNLLPTGTMKLHLEQGEIGMVAEDDICMGIFHSIDLPTNALTDGDDGRGNFTFAGFRAVYFRITQIEDPGVNSTLRYALRSVSGSYPVQWHPSEAMHFVCYGNFTDKSRQTSCCTTRTYTRFLTGVNTWEFSEANIAAQFGDLSNLSVFGLDMTGYSIFLNNIYMTGTINQFRKYPLRMEIDVQGPASMAWGETLPVVCTVYRGWEELTADVTRWTVSRDTGVPQDDAVWNQSVKARDFAGTLMVSLTDTENDLGNPPKGVTTVFTFTAEIGDSTQPVTAMLELG